MGAPCARYAALCRACPPPPPDHRYTSTLNTIVTIAREEGVPMLWKGYLARLSRLGPGYAIQWAVLDMVQKAWAP